MLRRIKYKLLCWLLDDICIKSKCKNCAMCHHSERYADALVDGCGENEVFVQARRAWGLKKE